MDKVKRKVKKATAKSKKNLLAFIGRYFRRKKKTGFTMIEVLIVLTIVSTFSTVGVVTLQSSQRRSRDSQRKSDLEKIRVALEDYYNDNLCYPPDGSFASCGSSELSPYLEKVPCDPKSQDPYLYVPETNNCRGYRLQAGLETDDDPGIAKAGCNAEVGCGYGPDYNYGIASGVSVFDPNGGYQSPGQGGTPSPSPVSSPSPTTIYVYACDAGGTCNVFEKGHPYLETCPITFAQSNCNNACGNPANRCL